METAISVIVPVYRVEKYLPACIDSILNQTFTDFELILVDDGSPDRCPAICDEAAERDARVRVIHQANAGLSAARNAGIEVAHGAWLSFVDSDDYIAPHFCEKLYQTAQRTDADCVMCSVQNVDESGKLIDSALMRVADEVKTGREVLRKIGRDDVTPYLTAWNKLYRRKLFNTLRYPAGRQNEDVFVFAELFCQVQRAVCVAEPLYFYRKRIGSIMNSVVTLRNLDEMWAYVNCFEHLQQDDEESTLKETEKRVFAKLTGVYYRVTEEDRHSNKMKQAKKAQWNIAMRLMKQGQLDLRSLARTLLFQALPGVYGLRMKG
mgnify:FL=1